MNTGGTGSGTGYQEPAPGLKVARIYKIIDLGTQEDEYEGTKKKSRNVLIFWELEQKTADGRPFSTFIEYNQYLGDVKCKLRKHIESWTSKSMTPEIIKAFDFQKFLLGRSMMVNLIRKPSGRVKVDNLMAPPAGTAKPAPFNPLVYFDLDAKPFDQATFDKLDPWVQKKIVKSPEYRRLPGEVIDDEPHGAPQGQHDGPPPIDDDTPF